MSEEVEKLIAWQRAVNRNCEFELESSKLIEEYKEELKTKNPWQTFR